MFFLPAGRMRIDLATSTIRPLLYGSNTIDHFYSSMSDERKICLKRDIPAYPKVILSVNRLFSTPTNYQLTHRTLPSLLGI